MNWQPEVYELLNEEKYEEVAHFYEQLIETEPEVISHYWYLGLAYLLAGEEEEAQTTWFYVFAERKETEIEQGAKELIEVLTTEAERQKKLNNYALAWLIRGHIRELEPSLVNNLLELIELEINLEYFTVEKLNEWEIINLLQESNVEEVDREKLLAILAMVLKFPARETLAFAEASLPHLWEHPALVATIMSSVIKNNLKNNSPIYAAELTKLSIKRQPENLSLIIHLFWCYFGEKLYEKSLETAYHLYEKSPTIYLKVYSNFLILTTLVTRGDWLIAKNISERHINLLKELIQQQPLAREFFIEDCFVTVTVYLPYIRDNAQENRWLHNQISQSWQQKICQKKVNKYINNNSEFSKLKIGYIASTFKRHSVGWLSRWLFHYHNREKFEIFIYLANQTEDEITQKWFRQKADKIYNFPIAPEAIVEQIIKDEIDILVELDSLTDDLTCKVIAFKPAPIQVTWLGWDASGIPAIDYFIADPFVLPDNCQAYYHEKIWRLPQTYLAVDGFEIGVPSIRRDELNIPPDAVVYLNIQNALKRHPDTIRLQMKIIKAVDNSYFLIKGSGEQELIKKMFTQLAEEEGVSPEKLRFLPRTNSEEIHRANISIADIVLDTYPYNGATTTLEVLWMGVPLVTRVGEQFSARNSYAFMRNVGLTEGIAYSDEEYVEWGIKLGLNAALREEISRKLKLSRHTSPLWNAKAFTKEMEKAYQQMWENYQNMSTDCNGGH